MIRIKFLWPSWTIENHQNAGEGQTIFKTTLICLMALISMMKILKTTKLKKAKVNYTMEMFNSTSIKNNQLELAEDAEVKEEELEAKCRLRMLRS